MSSTDFFQIANNLKAYRASLEALKEDRSPEYLREFYVDNESSPVPLKFYIKKLLSGSLKKEEVKSRLEELTEAWVEHSKEFDDKLKMDEDIYKKALELVKLEYHTAFKKFTETGESDEEFEKYLDHDKKAQQAVDMILTYEARGLEYLAQLIHKEEKK